MSVNILPEKKNSKRGGRSIGILPSKLVHGIQDELPGEKKTYPYYYRLLIAMLAKSESLKISKLEYTAISQNYVTEILGSEDKAKKALTDLMRTGLIQAQMFAYGTYQYFSDKKGQCRRLRINPKFLFGPVESVSLNLRGSDKVKYGIIENHARMHLEEVTLPFDTPEELEQWVNDYVRTKEIQTDIASRIKQLNPTNEKQYPKYAHVLAGDTSQVIEGKTILLFLRPGMRLFSYTPPKGRKPIYFISTYEKVLEWKTKEIASSYIMQLSILNEKVGRVSRNSRNNRQDSPVTNCYSSLIALMQVKGVGLFGIDVCNSQFTFKAAILKEIIHLLENHSQELNLFYNNALTNRPESIVFLPKKSRKAFSAFFTSLSTKYKLIPTLQTHHIQTLLPYSWALTSTNTYLSGFKHRNLKVILEPKNRFDFSDLKYFIRLCESGNLYEAIAAKKYYGKLLHEINEEQKKSIKDTYRKSAKAAMMGIAFDRWHVDHWSDEGDNKEKKANKAILRGLFPKLVAIVDYFKKSMVTYFKELQIKNPGAYEIECTRTDGLRKPDRVGNAQFAIMLQLIESYVMIDKVFAKIMRRHWCASKHDSILTTQTSYERVLKIMQKELDRFLGVGCYRLKKQSWHYDFLSKQLTTNEEAIEPTK